MVCLCTESRIQLCYASAHLPCDSGRGLTLPAPQLPMAQSECENDVNRGLAPKCPLWLGVMDQEAGWGLSLCPYCRVMVPWNHSGIPPWASWSAWVCTNQSSRGGSGEGSFQVPASAMASKEESPGGRSERWVSLGSNIAHAGTWFTGSHLGGQSKGGSCRHRLLCHRLLLAHE